jgi:hypothetical protein
MRLPTEAPLTLVIVDLFECNAKLFTVRPSYSAVANIGVTVDGKLKYLWNAKCSAETKPSAEKCQVGDSARKFVACRPISNGSAQIHGFAGMFSAVVHLTTPAGGYLAGSVYV